MKITLVITARCGSTRIPSKPYLKLDGIHILDTIIDAALGCSDMGDIILTSEDDQLLEYFNRNGIGVALTSDSPCCGTARVAELSDKCDATHFALIPCDIYPISSESIREFINACIQSGTDCATLVKPIEDETYFKNMANVKVLCDKNDDAVFYARSLEGGLSRYSPFVYQQVGLYWYSREALLYFHQQDKSNIEISESNESFRFLLGGWKMRCISISHTLHSVNDSADIDLIQRCYDVRAELSVGIDINPAANELVMYEND